MFSFPLIVCSAICILVVRNGAPIIVWLHTKKIGLVPRLPRALFLNFGEINILKFQKNKKYKDVVNYIHYESAIF
jgi:hypothetical protein